MDDGAADDAADAVEDVAVAGAAPPELAAGAAAEASATLTPP